MGLLERLFPNYDKYRNDANSIVDKVMEHCYQKFGDIDRDAMHDAVGKRLQYYIYARNNQGGIEANRYALAYWQIFKALYPEYIQGKPPTLVSEVWKKSV